MKTYLKIKIVSLAAEAVLIKREERRWKRGSDVRLGLAEHRRGIVRDEARSAQVAYGFLRGRDYRQVEPTSRTLPNLGRVCRLVQKYGHPHLSESQVQQIVCTWMGIDPKLMRGREAASRQPHKLENAGASPAHRNISLKGMCNRLLQPFTGP